MNHLTLLELSMHADGALLPAQSASVTEHLAACDTCRNRLANYAQEKQVVAQSLKSFEPDVPALEMPAFKKPITLKSFAVANLVTGLTLWLAQFLWKTLFGELVVNAAARVSEIYFPSAFEVFVDATLYLTIEGTTMIESYFGLILTVLTAALIAWIAYSVRQSRMLVSLSLVATLAMGILAPPSASALEVRRDESMVSIDETETINDTVIIMSETIIVEGNVTGDLVIMGRRIVVNGDVGGNLVTMGQAITIEGSVGGTLISASDTLELVGSAINWDLWSASSKTTIDNASNINGTAVVATELITVDGRIGRDLHAFAESVELSGAIGQDLEAYAGNIRLMGDATINGRLRARVDNEDDLTLSQSATIEGGVEFLSLPEEFEPSNKYASADYYFGQLFRLVSAFIVGFSLLWLIPTLRDQTLESGKEGAKTAGIGLLALVSTPIIALLCAVTVVGFPLGMLGMLAWVAGIYLAKIIVASMVGQMMLGATDYENNLFVTLLAGMTVIIVATALPAIGGIINFVLTIIGLGMLVRLIMDVVSDQSVDYQE